jgi:hypothetical protein
MCILNYPPKLHYELKEVRMKIKLGKKGRWKERGKRQPKR